MRAEQTQLHAFFFISNGFFELSLGVAYKKSLFGLKFCLRQGSRNDNLFLGQFIQKTSILKLFDL